VFFADGIQDFTFEADAPTGAVIMALLPIAAAPFIWEHYPPQ